MNADELLDKLGRYGADTAGAMERFLDDAELYATCIEMFIGDENFDQLGLALEAGEYRRAFESAHALKGVAANLGLTPLLSAIGDIVEPLRHEQYTGLDEEYQKILRQRAVVKALL